jgi:hypothetical protein
VPDDKWNCRMFSNAMPSGELPELLRRVAATIERIKPDEVFDIAIRDDGEEVMASVYFTGGGDPSE